MPKAHIQISTTRPPNEGPSPDAWLIECCHELLELEAENDRLYVPVADALPGDPVIDAWARFNDRTRDRRLELSSTIHETSAMTAAGLRAKALVVYKAVAFFKDGAPAPEGWGAYSLAVNILQWIPEPPTHMTAEKKAKDREFALRIDELASLWAAFTPPVQGEAA
jgi:hypothetical protein